MKWLKLALTLLVAWVRAHTAEKVRRAMSAEAKLQRELTKWQDRSDLEKKKVVEHGKRMLEHSEAGKKAKAKVKEIEERLGLWDDSPK